jgi:hypothetical protein
METACPNQPAPAQPAAPPADKQADPKAAAKPADAAAAQSLTEECRKRLAESAKAQLDDLPLPIGWAAAQAHYAKRNAGVCVPKPAETKPDADKPAAEKPPADAKPDPAAKPVCDPNLLELIVEQIRISWFWTIIGWIISALAVSMGAPFWFDTLQRLLNLRAAGVKPERRT